MTSDGEPPPRPPRGLVAALSSLAATTVSLVHTRLELVGVELEEERSRIGRLLALAVAGALFSCFTLVALSVLVVAAFWEEHAMGALVGLVVFYACLTLFVLLALKREASAAARPFAATLAELERDAAMLRGEP